MQQVKSPRARQKSAKIVQQYDIAADSKRRISLRGAKTKYFHVSALSNGSYILEPRVLVSPEVISQRTLRTIDQSVSNLKKGMASPPINLAKFMKKKR